MIVNELINDDGQKVSCNWDIRAITDDDKYPFVVIDNYYNEQELKSVWAELDFFSTSPVNIHRAETTVVAKFLDGQPRSKAYRWYPNSIYKHSDYYPKTLSSIQNFTYKLRTKQIREAIIKCPPYSRSFITSNTDNTIINYYDESDHYRAHHDTVLWTQVTWLYKEPKKFEGGDFDFPESGIEIKLKNNRSVLFPSCYLHRVSPIKMIEQVNELGWGRWCITTFISNDGVQKDA